MAFLGILVMAIGGAAVWYWRLKMMREAGSEIIDSVERMRGAYKRGKFRKQAAVAPLASIADPAIAAFDGTKCRDHHRLHRFPGPHRRRQSAALHMPRRGQAISL